MKIQPILATIAINLIGVGLTASPSQAAETTIEQMPAALETTFALSALPSALRDHATVYLLDPKTGYQRSRQGTSGVTCLVERTVWEWSDFRNDIYIPLCYDAVGTTGHLKVIMDAAGLRAEGMSATQLKTAIEDRYRNKTYSVPSKAGMSYMIAPLMRALGPRDMKMHTMSMPHLMFYAPGLTNDDIGAVPNLSDYSSLRYPFIDKQGNAEQSYMIQLVGEAEKAKILADERDDLVTMLIRFMGRVEAKARADLEAWHRDRRMDLTQLVAVLHDLAVARREEADVDRFAALTDAVLVRAGGLKRIVAACEEHLAKGPEDWRAYAQPHLWEQRHWLYRLVDELPLATCPDAAGILDAMSHLQCIRERPPDQRINVRYRRSGAVAYRHVGTNYIAYFTNFIVAGRL